MQWCIVSQVQMVIEEITSLIEPDEEISDEIINQAFENLLNPEHDNYFSHYLSRLGRVYGREKLPFVSEVLNICALEGSSSKNRIRDLAVKHGSEKEYRPMLDGLEYDGYINHTHDSDRYVFNSPILRLWWQKNAGNG